MKNKKLETRDLRISFRTANGKVQAVRGINFDLYEGETLAIVGESGSGKSVTSRAVMGILAPNAIVESGEIIYDGKDLLKFGESEFQQIRGDRIAMIFQDPLSSLNPIVKIGKQLTEAMILKNRMSRKRCRRDFDAILKELQKNVNDKTFDALVSNFRKADLLRAKLEKEYDNALEAANDALSKTETLLVAFEKKEEKNVVSQCAKIVKSALRAIHADVVDGGEEFKAILTEIEGKNNVKENLEKIVSVLQLSIAKKKPDFQSRGCYLTFSENKELADEEAMRKFTDEFLMKDFCLKVREAVEISREKHAEKRREALKELEESENYFKSEALDKKQTYALIKKLTSSVKNGIDPLDTRIDNDEHTFGTSLKSFVDTYFSGFGKNERENKRYQKEVKKCEDAEKKGKALDWKPVPAAIVDMELVKANIDRLIKRRIEGTKRNLENEYDYDEAADRVVKFLADAATGSVDKVTKNGAKRKAIKLMEEVGIPEPDKRYNQYPFQMSGGQRQRIVIAIALSANPDILICDEPTTALDVTIQAQTLELINRIKKERNLSVIFITHDLGVVANMADRVAIMYAGKIVEYGNVDEIFYTPAHPYTWALLSSVPDLESKEKLEAIPGTPPNMIYPPKGDAFAERNKYALKIDFEKEPPMFKITDTHYAATWLLHPMAPKVEIPKAITDRIARMRKGV